MGSEFTFRVDGMEGFQKALASVPARLAEEVRKATVESLAEFEAQMQARMTHGRAANTSAGDGVSVRTGTLRRSVRRTVTGRTIGDLVGMLTMGTKYAATLEAGDPARVPKTSKYLAIPLPAARTGAGVPRLPSPRNVMGAKSTLVQVGKRGKRVDAPARGQATFIKPARRGPGFVVYLRRGRDQAPIPMWRLVPSVNIPPHLGFEKTWVKMLPRVQQRMNAALARAIEKGHA